MNRKIAVLTVFCLLMIVWFKAELIAFGSDNDLYSFEKSLLNLRSDQAIAELCPYLNKALADSDLKRSAIFMRYIALAFRLDENDRAAVKAAEIAVKLDPQSTAAKFQLAEYAFRNGQYQDSEAILQDLEKSKSRKTSLRASAFLAQQLGDISGAIRGCKEYLLLQADDERVLARLSYLLISAEDYAQAAEIQESLAQKSLSPYLRKIFQGRAAEAIQKPELARQFYKEAGQENKQDPLWHSQLAMLFLKEQKINEANPEFIACFDCSRLCSQAFTNYAVSQAYFGKLENAHAALDHLRRLRPNANELYFACGLIFEKQQDQERAKEAFRQAARLNPHNSNPYLHLLQNEKKQNIKEKMEICRSWCDNCPSSATARIELGNLYRASSEDAQAIAYYEKAQAMLAGRKPPSDMSYLIAICGMHAHLAAYAYQNGQNLEALEQALKFNKLRPEPAKMAGLPVRVPRIDLSEMKLEKQRKAAEHALLADVLFEDGRLGDSEKEYRNAIKEDPDQIMYHSCLLKVLLEKKDYAQAALEDAKISQYLVKNLPNLLKVAG